MVFNPLAFPPRFAFAAQAARVIVSLARQEIRARDDNVRCTLHSNRLRLPTACRDATKARCTSLRGVLFVAFASRVYALARCNEFEMVFHRALLSGFVILHALLRIQLVAPYCIHCICIATWFVACTRYCEIAICCGHSTRGVALSSRSFRELGGFRFEARYCKIPCKYRYRIAWY